MLFRCQKCTHAWEQPRECEDRSCPRCYAKFRKRAARSKGPGTSHEVAIAKCHQHGAIGIDLDSSGHCAVVRY